MDTANYPKQTEGLWVRWVASSALVLIIAVGGAGFEFALRQSGEMAALKQQVADKIENDRHERQDMLESIRREFDLVRQDIGQVRQAQDSAARTAGSRGVSGPYFPHSGPFDK